MPSGKKNNAVEEAKKAFIKDGGDFMASSR